MLRPGHWNLRLRVSNRKSAEQQDDCDESNSLHFDLLRAFTG
jgi:hypothetical protein